MPKPIHADRRTHLWHHATAALGSAILVSPAVASAQVPIGPEFRVNSYTTYGQDKPSVAAAPDGRFVVLWQSSGQDGDDEGIFARRFSASGAPLDGSEFQVNTHTTNRQYEATVAFDASGGFVVIWSSFGQDGSGVGVYARRFDPAGLPLGGEFRVNTLTTGTQRYPSVASYTDGSFVVAWSGAGVRGQEIYARRFDAAGNPLDAEFRVNTYTSDDQLRPSVAMDGDGNFVVIWGQEYSDVSGRAFDAAGVPLGLDFRVDTYTSADAFRPALAHANGEFLVAWTNITDPGVDARRYLTGGTPQGPPFRVANHSAPFPQPAPWPRVAADPAGNFVVAWDGYGPHDSNGIQARRFNVEGTPENLQFPVNTHTTTIQDAPAVAIDGEGRFVIVWSSVHQDGSGRGIFGQRFAKDFIFRDGFEAGSLSAWSSSAAGGGDLSAASEAALNSSTVGMQAAVDDTTGLYVQDDTPQDEDHYRARFYLDVNSFDPGEALNHFRTRVFLAFSEDPSRRVLAIVLRRIAGSYALMARARLDDDSQASTSFLPIADNALFLEIDWKAARSAGANDGWLHFWINGNSASSLTDLDNSTAAVDFVRLGALSVKSGASGTLYWDEFESRRWSYIGP